MEESPKAIRRRNAALPFASLIPRLEAPTDWRATRALASSFVPEIERASEAEWQALEAALDRALAARPPAVRRQLALFLRLLAAASWLRYGRSLARLDAGRRGALLAGFAHAPSLLLRRGIWGLRTLIMLGWYTQPSVAAAIGYRADPKGWDARR
jgi:hypothetical protein